MKKEEFLNKFGGTKVRFKSYYKDTFIFGCTIEGTEIDVWITGDAARAYNINIDADKEYEIDALSMMIHSAGIETKEEFIQVDFTEDDKK